ncbi:ImmA/IrrE family metallo-endopeptidase [Amycolatopsis granulosa]|uniref:ImmA/IrrE family metallo-endopeptidase n=1 Tax=Amycolatopsis granulosa TaxID=185684 RepID=UPI001ABAA68C
MQTAAATLVDQELFSALDSTVCRNVPVGARLQSTGHCASRCPGLLSRCLSVTRGQGSLVSKRRCSLDAFSLYIENEPFIFIDTGKTAERQRFDAAHELGHLVMHQGRERPRAAGRLVVHECPAPARQMWQICHETVSEGELHTNHTASAVTSADAWKL